MDDQPFIASNGRDIDVKGRTHGPRGIDQLGHRRPSMTSDRYFDRSSYVTSGAMVLETSTKPYQSSETSGRYRFYIRPDLFGVNDNRGVLKQRRKWL